ncbi:MAG: stalk domain-containing protein, partial [Candidatus Poribacteria bacterium]|nr:stalk domain-containing protein [Candidatus Poribacteria bacterium]
MKKVKKPLNSLRNPRLSPVGAGTTTRTNNTICIKKAQGKYVNRYAASLKAGVLFLGILVFAATLSSIAQQPSVRFIDADGKTIAEVPAQHREAQVYLPIDAVKQIIDPATTHQYNHPRKRLTLKTKGRQIRLQMDKPTVSIDPGGQTVTLSTPPIIIEQRPMLPIAFFKQLLPILNDVDVIYNSNLNRLQIRPKGTWTPIEKNNTQNWGIIVDPGHGGNDQGCEGSTGILEKNVV